ncbi:MAG: nuclear transport factor 2 family protein [Novosphingobium sp.]
MKKIAFALSALALLGACSTQAPADPTARNRKVIQDFARIFYSDKDVKRAFETYVVPDYIQHNPGIADGRDAAVAALTPMFSAPGAKFDVKHIVVDGDLAVIHLFGQGDPSTKGAAVADIYRLKDGKIVEHWDILQPMPEKSANPHPMF